jgi:hypothetical protein
MASGADRGRRAGCTRSDDEQRPAGANQPLVEGAVYRSPSADHLVTDADRSQTPTDVEKQWLYEMGE